MSDKITKAALLDLLHQGWVHLKFIKKDGSERVMTATLKEGWVEPYQKKTDRVRRPTDENYVRAWTPDGFRTINVDTILWFVQLPDSDAAAVQPSEATVEAIESTNNASGQ